MTPPHSETWNFESAAFSTSASEYNLFFIKSYYLLAACKRGIGVEFDHASPVDECKTTSFWSIYDWF